jgi:hypothetical protein
VRPSFETKARLPVEAKDAIGASGRGLLRRASTAASSAPTPGVFRLAWMLAFARAHGSNRSGTHSLPSHSSSDFSDVIGRRWTNDDLLDWELRERLINAVATRRARLRDLDVPPAFKEYVRGRLGWPASRQRRTQDQQRQLRRSADRRLHRDIAEATTREKLGAWRIVAAGDPSDPAARRARTILRMAARRPRSQDSCTPAPRPIIARRQPGQRRRRHPTTRRRSSCRPGPDDQSGEPHPSLSPLSVPSRPDLFSLDCNASGTGVGSPSDSWVTGCYRTSGAASAGGLDARLERGAVEVPR